MKLAIADPPYPPIRAVHPKNDSSRARRWYGDPTYQNSGDAKGRKADFNPEAGIWDDPETHQALMARLDLEYDGWAIATAHDGVPVYGQLPRGARIAIWVRPNAPGTASSIRNCWEAVIVSPPKSRLSSRAIGGQVNDVLTASVPHIGFAGSKPREWTRWVLAMLGYDPSEDTVEDVFHGSGSVAAAVDGMLA